VLRGSSSWSARRGAAFKEVSNAVRAFLPSSRCLYLESQVQQSSGGRLPSFSGAVRKGDELGTGIRQRASTRTPSRGPASDDVPSVAGPAFRREVKSRTNGRFGCGAKASPLRARGRIFGTGCSAPRRPLPVGPFNGAAVPLGKTPHRGGTGDGRCGEPA